MCQTTCGLRTKLKADCTKGGLDGLGIWNGGIPLGGILLDVIEEDLAVDHQLKLFIVIIIPFTFKNESLVIFFFQFNFWNLFKRMGCKESTEELPPPPIILMDHSPPKKY